MLVHVVYLSAIPVFPVDDKKRTPVLAANSEPLEPWEVNQELIDRKGEAASFDGWTLYEGDIVLDMRTRLLIRGGHLRRKRAVKKLQSSRWPNGEIPYVVDRDLAMKTKKEIRKALRHWKKKTCLHFRHKRDSDVDYIRFVYEPG